MGLSNETPPNSSMIEQYQFDLARIKARQLGSALIKGEHNPTPSPYDLPNPAHGVRIRRIDPEKSRVTVDEQCKMHNEAAANLGQSVEWGNLWKH